MASTVSTAAAAATAPTYNDTDEYRVKVIVKAATENGSSY